MSHTKSLAVHVIALTLFAASGLEAETTVKACSTDTQTGAGPNLAQALSSGGAIYFDCPRPTTIRMTQTYTLDRETQVWGGDAVTLDGSGGFGFSVNGSAYFAHIALTSFVLQPIRYFDGINASAFRVNRTGSLQLDHVTVTGSDTPVGSLGSLRIGASSFQHNSGVAVVSIGPTFSLENTAFSANETAVFMGAGSILESAFDSNTRGAIVVDYPRQDVEIRNSTFDNTTGNTPIAISQLGSSTSSVTVTVRRDTFRNNQGGAGAGAVAVYDPGSPAIFDGGRARRAPRFNPYYLTLPRMRFELDFDTFTDNIGQNAGAVALDLRRTGGALIKGGLFTGNANVPVAGPTRSLNGGGAINVSGGSLEIVESAFVKNRALFGAAVLFQATAGGSISVANCLVAQNAASGTVRASVGHPATLIPASALSLGAPAVVANSTIAKNESVGLVFEGNAEQLTLANTILTQNTVGNCSGVAAGANHGANVQFGATDCPGVAVIDPQLDTLYVPQIGGFTSSHGDVSVCRSSPVSGVDILFQLRESPAGCAIGAFERPPIRFVKPPQGSRSP